MNFQPPDPVCKFCDDNCSGTCEGAREARIDARDFDELMLKTNNLEGALQLTEEALYFALRDAKRYEVVRSHAADVTPEEMDLGADTIIAARAAAEQSQPIKPRASERPEPVSATAKSSS